MQGYILLLSYIGFMKLIFGKQSLLIVAFLNFDHHTLRDKH